jgi:hypothetical protein
MGRKIHRVKRTVRIGAPSVPVTKLQAVLLGRVGIVSHRNGAPREPAPVPVPSEPENMNAEQTLALAAATARTVDVVPAPKPAAVPRETRKRNDLTDANKFKLYNWLKENDGLWPPGVTPREVAAKAEADLGIRVTEFNVTGALSVVGLELPKAKGPVDPGVKELAGVIWDLLLLIRDRQGRILPGEIGALMMRVQDLR